MTQAKGQIPALAELKKLSPLDLGSYCAISKVFAFAICGSGQETIVSAPNKEIFYSVAGAVVPDSEVRYQLWKMYVRKQHGLSVRPEKCDAFSGTERALVAESMQRFCPAMLPNLELLRRYKYLYMNLLTQPINDLLRKLNFGLVPIVCYQHGLVTLVDKVKINNAANDRDENYIRRVEMRSVVDLVRRQYLQTPTGEGVDQKLVLHQLSFKWTANRTDYGTGGLAFTETLADSKRHTVIWMGDKTAVPWRTAQITGDFEIISFNVDPRFPNFAYICALTENKNRLVYEYSSELNTLTKIDFPKVGKKIFFYTKLFHGEQVETEYDAEFVITNHTTGQQYKIPVQVYNNGTVNFSCFVIPTVRTEYSADQASRHNTSIVVLSFPQPTVNVIELPDPRERPAQLSVQTFKFPREFSDSEYAVYSPEFKLSKNSVAVPALFYLRKGSKFLPGVDSDASTTKGLVYVSLDYNRFVFSAIPDLAGFRTGYLSFPNRTEWHSISDLELRGIVREFFPQAITPVITKTE